MSIFCPACGEENRDSAPFCELCQTMFRPAAQPVISVAESVATSPPPERAEPPGPAVATLTPVSVRRAPTPAPRLEISAAVPGEDAVLTSPSERPAANVTGTPAAYRLGKRVLLYIPTAPARRSQGGLIAAGVGGACIALIGVAAGRLTGNANPHTAAQVEPVGKAVEYAPPTERARGLARPAVQSRAREVAYAPGPVSALPQREAPKRLAPSGGRTPGLGRPAPAPRAPSQRVPAPGAKRTEQIKLASQSQDAPTQRVIGPPASLTSETEDSFLCPSTGHYVEVGDLAADVVAKCGPPGGKPNNKSVKTRGTTSERWVYDFGETYFTHILWFQLGRLIRIEEGGYGGAH